MAGIGGESGAVKPETVNETTEKEGDTTDKLEPADSEALEALAIKQVITHCQYHPKQAAKLASCFRSTWSM